MALSAVRDRPRASVALNLHDVKTLIFAACVDTFALLKQMAFLANQMECKT
jgi:hypothetical protein